MESQYIGALDIGGTKIAAVIAGPQGPLAKLSEPTVKSGPSDALPRQAIALLESACAKVGVPADKLNSIGVASCGPFISADGMVALATPNICGGLAQGSDLPNDWTRIPLERELRERFQNVAVENDCVAALVAERTFGAVQGEPDCVYVTWSTGIGFGFCVNGNILRGKHGNAGHAGHMLVSERQDAVCGCGNRGDLEGLISGRNIGSRLGLSAVELFDLARQGNKEAIASVEEAARWFGRGLYNMVAALDTRVIVVGGSVWMHHGDWLGPIVRAEIASHFPALTADVTVVGAKLGNLVADIGALSLVIPAEWAATWRNSQPWQHLTE